ncbi:MAG: hypothetical protein N2Z62_02910 [Rhodobacteraceae bacterium]|nr:hypothetical protein [Paracoccaceae bacterium]
MFSFLPKEVREGLETARARDLVRRSRLRIVADGKSYPVIRMRREGFSLPEGAPHLRGLVDLYDGARLVAQCLVIASAEESGQMRYEYKRRTDVSDRPALDFAQRENAPVALIPRAPDGFGL